MKLFDFSLKDVDWGPDEAKGDTKLSEYFVECNDFKSVLSGAKRYIIGRKGSGKTAIMQKIRLLSESDPCTFTTDVSLRDFPLNDFKTLGDRSFEGKSKYVSIWKFLLLVKFAELILSSEEFIFSYDFNQLRNFINCNFPGGVSIASAIQIIKSNESKVSVFSSFLSGEHSRTSEQDTSTEIQFSMASDYLQELIINLLRVSNSKYYVLCDELDEGYNQNDDTINLTILALLRANENLSIEFSGCGLSAHCVIAIRSDIYNSLSDNDLNKLDDYLWVINWDTSTTGPNSLLRILNHRICASFQKKYPDVVMADYFNLVLDSGENEVDVWRHACMLTYSRPRDIVKLLKYCASIGGYLSISLLLRAEDKYSEWFYNEFRDEVQSFLPCRKSTLNCLSEIGQGKAEISALKDMINANTQVFKWLNEKDKSSDDIISLLFNYSVIGCVNSFGHWFFKYKDDALEIMPSYKYYCIHYGLCRKLRIVKNSYKDYKVLAQV